MKANERNGDEVDMLAGLIETDRDGMRGARAAAERVDEPELREVLVQRANDYAQCAGELEGRLAELGGAAVETNGSAGGALRTGWTALRGSMPGDTALAMFEEAEKCEDRTIATYREALARQMSPETRRVVERQYESARLAHQAIRGIRDRLRATA